MNTRLAIVLVALLVLAAAGCRTKGPSFDPRLADLEKRAQSGYQDPLFLSILAANPVSQTLPKPSSAFYTLGPGDVIDLEIIGDSASTAQLIVGPDGKIYYSLLPGLSVWGLTLTEAKTMLEDQLTKFIRIKPEVSITLRGVASKRIWILGNVQNPGIYTLATPMNLLEAIAAAGGTVTVPGAPDESVDFKNSFVMRNGQVMKVDFHRLVQKGDLTQNIYLETGDYIYMRPSVSRDVYVLGMVALPNVVRHTDNLSLLAAIAAVGGPVRFAYLSQVAIVRGSLSSPAIAVVDYKEILTGKLPDIKLEEGDIVYVPMAPYARLQNFAENILREFVRTVAINEGNAAVVENPQPVSVSIGSGGASP